MKQNKFKVDKKLLVKYKKIIIDSSISAFVFGFNVSFLTASQRIANIKVGEYPEQPIAIRNELLSEAMPGIIISSILIGLLLTIVMFIIGLIIRFRRDYNIYLIHEIRLYLKRKKASKNE